MNERQTAGMGPMDMFELWTDTWSKMWGAGMAQAGDGGGPDAFRQVRSAMLSAWGDYFNRFMRSPEFLEALKQMMDVNVACRRKANDLLGQMQDNLQMASRQDVDQMMRTMRHLEHRLMDGIERISCEQERLGQRLEALEKAQHGHD
jgi:hypothetical protein